MIVDDFKGYLFSSVIRRIFYENKGPHEMDFTKLYEKLEEECNKAEGETFWFNIDKEAEIIVRTVNSFLGK